MELLISEDDLGHLIEDLTRYRLTDEKLVLKFIRTGAGGVRWHSVWLTRRQVRILTREIPRDILVERYHAR